MQSIHKFLQQELINRKSPSIQYAFFTTDATMFSFLDGNSDIKSGTAVNAATTYNLFSITKTFTALAVLQLVEKGMLQVDARVSDYLPAFPYPAEILVDQLLRHTAGIPNPLPLRWTHLPEEHAAFNRNQFFAALFRKHPRLKFSPGSKFMYSNLGYVLLGQLIEQVSGKPYEQYVAENILEPAGIARQDLGFSIDVTHHAKGYQKYWSFINVALAFMIDRKKFMGRREGDWKPFNHFYINGTPYGGLIGSGRGLVQYAQALMRRESPLISGTLRQGLFRETLVGDRPAGMAMGWFTGALQGNKFLCHAGGGGGYYIELRIYPGLGSGSVLLQNRSGLKDERMLDKADQFFLP